MALPCITGPRKGKRWRRKTLCEAALWAVFARCSDAEWAAGCDFLEGLIGAARPAHGAADRGTMFSDWEYPTLSMLICRHGELREVCAALQAQLGWGRQQAASALLSCGGSSQFYWPAQGPSLLTLNSTHVEAVGNLLR